MKKIAVYFFIMMAFTLTGCDKYLEKEPDNRAKLTDPKKVSQLLASAYPLANYMAFNEAMSDNADDKGEGEIHPTNQSPYFFENVQTTDQDSPDNYWNECYKAIASANEALNACNNAANPDDYKKQRGEALLTRAYSHYMLVTLYAKPYNPTTAGSNPGVPYVTEPETVVIKQYDRKTVAYVYEMIEKDLLEGLPLIDDAAYDKKKYHFNRAASNAFASRFFLGKGDYQKVVQYATTAIPNFLPNLRAWNTTYQTYGINNLPAQYQRSTDPANLLLVSCATIYNWNLRYVTYRYALSNDTKDEILNTSIQVTGGAWSFITGYVGSQSSPAIPKLNYNDFVYETPTSNFGVGYGLISLFTTEEVLFNKAEANTYLGNYDVAIADLNTYMSTRITGATPGALAPARQITQAKVIAHYNGRFSIKDALIRYILELKRAEFIHEGMRWFDILRYNLPVTHRILNGTPTGSFITIDPNDKRRQLKLPDGVKLSGITDLNR